MIKIIRRLLWRLLGFDYQMLLNKTDYVLLKNDTYTQKGIKTLIMVQRYGDGPMHH